jgi:hypothetical protein
VRFPHTKPRSVEPPPQQSGPNLSVFTTGDQLVYLDMAGGLSLLDAPSRTITSFFPSTLLVSPGLGVFTIVYFINVIITKYLVIKKVS